MSVSTIIKQLREDDESIINQIYIEYRESFVQWLCAKYSLNSEEGIELFQYAVVVFYDNVMSGKLTELSGSVKTYLYAVGKNKALQLKREKSRWAGPVEDHLVSYIGVDSNLDPDEAEQQIKLVDQAMHLLGDPCRGILKAYYFLRQTMQEIAESMEYKNSDTVKNLKYKCIKRLKKICKSLKVTA